RHHPRSTLFPSTTLFRSIGRITGEQHRAPEWYKDFTLYGPVLLVGTFPWTWWAVRSVLSSFRALRRGREPRLEPAPNRQERDVLDRKSTRLNSSHVKISY